MKRTNAQASFFNYSPPYSARCRSGAKIALILIASALSALPVSAQTRRDVVSFYNEARSFMLAGDYYRASQSLLDGLKQNPSHAESNAALAECYYNLGEYEEALSWVRKARTLARGNLAVLNLESFILIAMGNLDEAETALKSVLQAEPNNKEALFVQGEIDLARGKEGEALRRYREAVRLYPDDRRLLLSLALVSLSLGDSRNAQNYIERAMTAHPDDYRVYYYAAFIDARNGRTKSAIENVEQALYYNNDFPEGLRLLAGLRYKNGDFEEAAALSEKEIAQNRADIFAHYLKGLSLSRLGEQDAPRLTEARTALETALSIDGDDEFVRALLEDILLQTTSMEDSRRARFAAWHFRRAENFRRLNLSDEALFEYRRALRINPYAAERRDYAALLKLKGWNEAYLAELSLIKDLHGGDADAAAAAVALDDAIEALSAKNRDALSVRYNIGREELKRHWKISVFNVDNPAEGGTRYHIDSGSVAAAYLKDILIHDRNIDSGSYNIQKELRRSSFAEAFRASRAAGDDYFLLVSLEENERDLLLKAVLYASRTGTELKTFSAYRSGENRLRNAARNIVSQLDAALPFRAQILRRDAAIALIDKGRLDGVAVGAEYEIVRQGKAEISTDGIALKYAAADAAGTFTVTRADEEAAQGTLKRSGFFDRIAVGDEVTLQPKTQSATASSVRQISPELRDLLRLAR